MRCLFSGLLGSSGSGLLHRSGFLLRLSGNLCNGLFHNRLFHNRLLDNKLLELAFLQDHSGTGRQIQGDVGTALVVTLGFVGDVVAPGWVS